jgi:hypothetical protein
MLIKVFQIVLVLLVALFTLAGLTLLLSALESTLIARAGVSSFAFAVSARAFRIFVIGVLLLSAAAVVWFIRRRH